jgi:hypothetical protein
MSEAQRGYEGGCGKPSTGSPLQKRQSATRAARAEVPVGIVGRGVGRVRPYQGVSSRPRSMTRGRGVILQRRGLTNARVLSLAEDPNCGRGENRSRTEKINFSQWFGTRGETARECKPMLRLSRWRGGVLEGDFDGFSTEGAHILF